MSRQQPLPPSARCGMGLILVLSLLGSGCGGKKGDVSGTVTYRGRAVPAGTVTFLDAANQSVGSSPITEGSYVIRQVPVGPVKILVTTPPVSTRPVRLPSHLAKSAPDGEAPTDRPLPRKLPAGRQAGAVVIPPRYGHPEGSGLTFTVQPGPQEHPIELN